MWWLESIEGEDHWNEEGQEPRGQEVNQVLDHLTIIKVINRVVGTGVGRKDELDAKVS